MYIMRTSCEDQNLQNPGTEVRIIDNDGAPGRPPVAVAGQVLLGSK